MNVFMGHIGPQAKLLFAAEPTADVGGNVAAAAVVGGHRHRAHIGGALGHVVDPPARLRHSALQARQALEQLYLLLVFKADVLLAGDGAPIDRVAAGRVQGETAHHEVLVVTDGGVAFAHGGIIFQHIAEQACLLILNQRFGEDRNSLWGVQQGRRVKLAHRRGVCLIPEAVFAGD